METTDKIRFETSQYINDIRMIFRNLNSYIGESFIPDIEKIDDRSKLLENLNIL